MEKSGVAVATPVEGLPERGGEAQQQLDDAARGEARERRVLRSECGAEAYRARSARGLLQHTERECDERPCGAQRKGRAAEFSGDLDRAARPVNALHRCLEQQPQALALQARHERREQRVVALARARLR